MKLVISGVYANSSQMCSGVSLVFSDRIGSSSCLVLIICVVSMVRMQLKGNQTVSSASMCCSLLIKLWVLWMCCTVSYQQQKKKDVTKCLATLYVSDFLLLKMSLRGVSFPVYFYESISTWDCISWMQVEIDHKSKSHTCFPCCHHVMFLMLGCKAGIRGVQ